jgi:transmembrane sensor
MIAVLSAASILLLFTFSWLFFSKTLDKTLGLVSEAELETDVRPASSGAQLIFADGETISLNTKAVTEKRNGVKLVHDGKEMHYTTETSIPDQKTKYNTLVVPKASFFRMVLADGTKVWVNAMSKLRFPVVFSPSERRVFLEGEAYFEVAHDANRPFVVDVDGDRIVKVLGTHFNVNTYHDRLYATLAEGKVEVFAGNQSNVLMPGQKAYVVRDQINVRNADLKRDLAWKNGEFYFKDDNLVQIAHQLSLWYDLDIRFGSSVSTTKTYSGSIGRDVNLSEVLDLLSYATKLSFEVEGKKLTISETKKIRI